MKPFILEVGKTYWTRGNVTTPPVQVTITGKDKHFFMGSNGCPYYWNGYCYPDTTSGIDLLSEVAGGDA